MKKDKFYFSHDYYAREDIKLKNLQMEHGMEAIGIYWCLVEMLHENGGKLGLYYKQLSFVLQTNIQKIEAVILSDLFENDGTFFWSNSALLRIKEREKKAKTAAENVSKRWLSNNNTTVIQTKKVCNAIKGKEIKGNKEKRARVFSVPKVPQIVAQFIENGYPLPDAEKQAESFFNYYESKGWMVGKTKMKSWKAAVANWVNRQKEFSANKNTTEERYVRPMN